MVCVNVHFTRSFPEIHFVFSESCYELKEILQRWHKVGSVKFFKNSNPSYFDVSFNLFQMFPNLQCRFSFQSGPAIVLFFCLKALFLTFFNRDLTVTLSRLWIWTAIFKITHKILKIFLPPVTHNLFLKRLCYGL